LLVQAGASGARPTVHSGPTSASTTPCASYFHITFVADVAGLSSATDAAGWLGVQEAVAHRPCLQANFISSTHPSDYRHNLQAAADQHGDLVIAGSFLLGEAVVDAATANPGTRFVLVDPLVSTAGPSNLATITFREDQAGFLAGALAGLTTRSGVIAGVYGLEDEHNRRYRLGFDRGAKYVNSSVRVMGAYQGSQDGSPYANPEWGAAEANVFLDQGADVIFTTGDLTGHGALTVAAQTGQSCITVALSPDPSAPACLEGTVLLHLDRALAAITTEAAIAHWQGGEHRFGLADDAIELSWSGTSPPSAEVRNRLQVIADLLRTGKI
jgi:basic membrane protein A and related proteins